MKSLQTSHFWLLPSFPLPEMAFPILALAGLENRRPKPNKTTFKQKQKHNNPERDYYCMNEVVTWKKKFMEKEKKWTPPWAPQCLRADLVSDKKFLKGRATSLVSLVFQTMSSTQSTSAIKPSFIESLLCSRCLNICSFNYNTFSSV